MSASASAPSLRRVLHFRTIVSTSTGLAYAAISLLACIQVASYMAGDSAWIALLIAGVLALLAAFCFSELNALYPSAAAIRQYLRAAFNEKTSLIISFAYVLTIVAVIAADSYVVGSAVSYVFPQTPAILWILLILALAAGANLFGIRIAGLLQDITTYGLLVSLAIISILALSRHGFTLHQPFAGLGNPGNLLNAVAVGVFVFSAFEWVTPLSEEMTDTRLIPRGMFIALGLLFISYALFTVAATNLVGIASLKDSPVPQMLLGRATLGEAGVIWMLIATLFTGVMTFNGGFATASRFLYAAAREATLPPIFARLSIARAVPWVTVLILAGSSAIVAVVIDITREFNILILIGAVLEALIYAAAGLCVIQLRRRQPANARSFRIPFGWTIPLLTIVIFTLLGIAAAVSPTPLPLLITAIVFAISFIYVQAVVPRLKAAEEQRRAARGRRRPPRHPESATTMPANDMQN
ncbi:MAG TPA: APC family permease [Ktedonobacterales bacterium]|nr:APC family permease [Ktedonobacterales bacterium]